MERVGVAANGEESKRGRGRLQPQLGRGRGGRLGLGRRGGGGSHPPDRDQWPKLALPFKLPTPTEKMPKDLLFSEECLLKLQTLMPQNMKEKSKISLTSFFRKLGYHTLPPLKRIRPRIRL
jgi:hypothetical protein